MGGVFGSVAVQWSTCLVCVRPWVQSLAPPTYTSKKTFKNYRLGKGMAPLVFFCFFNFKEVKKSVVSSAKSSTE